MRKTFPIALIFCLMISYAFAGTNYTPMNIKITVHGLENSSMILANYYGDKQYVKDTIRFDRNGTIVLKADTTLPGGVYLAVFPKLNNRYFEFIITESSFTIETDEDDLTGHVKVIGSLENKLFYDDMKFLGEKKTESDRIGQLYKNASSQYDKDKYKAQLVQIDNEVKAKRKDVVDNNPNLFYAKLLKAMKDIDVPDAPRDYRGAMLDSTFQWRYYKTHYWDNVDLRDERLLRCPVFHNKLKTFFGQTIVQIPDSIIAGGEELLAKTDKKNEVYRYILTYVFNEMANSKVMGFDAAYVHFGKDYFCKENMTPWIESEKRFKICDRATRLEPVLVGKKAQKLILPTDESETQWKSLQDVKAKYTILSFWDPDAGHCKKEIPILINAYHSLRNKGIDVAGFSVAIMEIENYKDWIGFIQENNIDWINVCDARRHSNFRFEWDIQSTPQIYILDRDKTIKARRIGADQVEDYILHIENPGYKGKLTSKVSDDDVEEGVDNNYNYVASAKPTNSENNQRQKVKAPVEQEVKSNLPPILSISDIKFSDANNNDRVDGNENCSVNFNIQNKGKGRATNLKAVVSNQSAIKGLNIDNLYIGDIEAGATKKASIPINGSLNLTSGSAKIKISFEEKAGFQPDPVEFIVETREFMKPNVIVADNSFQSDNGIIKLGLPIQLKALIQNIGQGTAENLKVRFKYPNQNVMANSESSFDVGTLGAGEKKDLLFEFIANKLYTEREIPISIDISEKYGMFSESKKVTVSIDSKSATTTFSVSSKGDEPKTVNIERASLSSDVDKNIPVNTESNAHRYALIIGNEDYTKYQTNLSSESNVAFAANDASIFAAYCEKTLGVQKDNITLLENAIGSKMKQEIDKISKLIHAEKGEAEVIFYYAGHGFPDEATKESYIMPVDISGSNVTDGIKLSDLYQKLTANPVKRVSVFLDACFSGGGRDGGLLSARSVKIKPKANAISGNILVLSASSGEQSSLPFKDKQHGMFTYYLLKKLQESKGDILYKDLFEYVNQQVVLNSIKVNGKEQNPELNYSSAIDGTWAGWKLK